MAVYLDTNVLVQRAGLQSLELTAVIALCREAGIDVVLPSLVADEVESSRLRVLEASFDTLRAAHREAAQLAPVATLPELPNPGELAREYRRGLGEFFAVVRTPDEAPVEALRRETFRLPPARAGRGARDSAIWLTVRDDHLRRDEPGYFVSNNSRDFGAQGQAEVLNTSLASEIAHHPHPLKLVPSLAALVDALAEESVPFVAEDTLMSLPRFTDAAVRSVHDAAFLKMLEAPPDLNAKPDGQLFVSSDVTVLSTGIRSFRGYAIADRKIVVGRFAWDLVFDLGTFEKSGAGRIQRSIPVKCQVLALVWLAQGADGHLDVAEVTQILSVRTSMSS